MAVFQVDTDQPNPIGQTGKVVVDVVKIEVGKGINETKSRLEAFGEHMQAAGKEILAGGKKLIEPSTVPAP